MKDKRAVLAHRDQFRPLPVSEQGSSTRQGDAAITAKVELPELLPDATDEPQDRSTTETDSGDGVPQETALTPVVRRSERNNK